MKVVTASRHFFANSLRSRPSHRLICMYYLGILEVFNDSTGSLLEQSRNLCWPEYWDKTSRIVDKGKVTNTLDECTTRVSSCIRH